MIGDTAVQMTDADRKTWHDTAMALHGLQQTANEAAEAVAQLGTQFQTLENLLKTSANAPPAAKTAIEDVGKQLADLRRRLGVAAPGARPGGGGGGGAAMKRAAAAVVVAVVVAAASAAVSRTSAARSAASRASCSGRTRSRASSRCAR